MVYVNETTLKQPNSPDVLKFLESNDILGEFDGLEINISTFTRLKDGTYTVDGVPCEEGDTLYRKAIAWTESGPGRLLTGATDEEVLAYLSKEAGKSEIQRWVSEGEDMILETQLVLSGYTVTPAQGMTNMAALEPIQNLLKNGSLNVARQSIVDLDLTGLSLTEQDRTDLLAILDEKLVGLTA